METMGVTVPQGMSPGMSMTVNVKGQDMTITIPEGVGPGMQFQFQVPAAQPVMAQPVMAQPVGYGQPVAYGAPPPPGYGPPPPGYGAPPPPTVIVQERPQQVLLVNQGPQMMEETYCGILSCLIGCFIPCGCWICLCPIDTRLIPVQ